MLQRHNPESADKRHEVCRAKTDTDNTEKFVEKKGLPTYLRFQQLLYDLTVRKQPHRLANLTEDTKQKQERTSDKLRFDERNYQQRRRISTTNDDIQEFVNTSYKFSTFERAKTTRDTGQPENA
eukprot:4453303-Amphidinium_carterae.1